jgi:MFS family permease
MARAYPFLISGVLILLGLAATSRLDARLQRYVTGEVNGSIPPALTGELEHLQPDPLRNVVVYWIDVTQAVALIIGPLLGVLILINLSNAWVVAIYALAILFGIGLIVRLALIADEGTYNSRAGRLGLTPVTSVALVIDIAAGLVAYFAGR